MENDEGEKSPRNNDKPRISVEMILCNEIGLA